MVGIRRYSDGLQDGRLEFDARKVKEAIFFSAVSGTALGLTKTLIQ
jgi:hypothetical protein